MRSVLILKVLPPVSRASFFAVEFLGFRFATPQALCCRRASRAGTPLKLVLILSLVVLHLPLISFGQRAQTSKPNVSFEEVPAKQSGITWVHNNAHSNDRYLPETVGAGCAFLDYDNDGWMDLYFVNSGPCDFYRPKAPLRNALYKNCRDGTFRDVTLAAGVAGGTFGMGAAVGDYNNDGYPDLFVTAYGRCILYRNNGDGTFTDVTEQAGVAAPGWTTSAVWFDYDNDGRLDLFVCGFVDFGLAKQTRC